jgi:peroxiredoxin
VSETYDPRVLPSDLPAPEDDGACDHLPGMDLPDLELGSTTGPPVNLRGASTTTGVFYFYPHTGRPGQPPPREWDAIPGARGCTPQSCAFRDHHAELDRLGATVYGVSAQTTEEQREFAEREHIPFPLLSDPELRVARALDLPTFEFDGAELYKRVTLIATGGRIVKVFYPVFPPDRNASDVAAWLEHRQPD